MIPVDGRGHLPEPRPVVYRGLTNPSTRLAHVFGRFALLVAGLFFTLGNLPATARRMLDPTPGAGPGGLATPPTPAAMAAFAFGLPLLVLFVAWVLASTQRSFAFRGRRIALRKQAWALFREFQETIEGHYQDGEEPVGFRMADPPELATSLLLRLGLFWLGVAACLLAVVIPLGMRIHWPAWGQTAWYGITLALTALGFAVLRTTRAPPVLRLFIQSALPAMHFGHGLIMGVAPTPLFGLPAAPLDFLLGLVSGLGGYRLGQRERGGALLVFTTRGVLAFDPAGRETRQLWAMRPLESLAWRAHPTGVRARLTGAGTTRALAFDSEDSVAEIPDLLAARGVSVEGERLPPRRGPLAALREPGRVGAAFLAALVLLLGGFGTRYLRDQHLLAHRLLPHLPAWGGGDPAPLLAGAEAALAEAPGFFPAAVLRAVALADLGRFDAAREALAALPPDAALEAFAARVLPPRRRWLAAVAAIEGRVAPGPSRDREVAAYLLSEVGTPAAAATATRLLAARAAPDAEDHFLRGLAALLAGSPDDAALSRALAALGAAPRGAFLRAWRDLAAGRDADALREARGEFAGMAGPLGRRLSRLLGLRFIGAVQRDPARRPEALSFFGGVLAVTPPGEARREFRLLAIACREAAAAARAYATLRAEDGSFFTPEAPPTLGRVLAEEAAGHRDWAEYSAYRLCGAEVARFGDPDRAPSLRPLPPAARRFVGGLAWIGLGRPEVGASWLAAGGGEGGYPGWGAARAAAPVAPDAGG